MFLCFAFAISEVAVDGKSLPAKGVIIHDKFCICCKHSLRGCHERVDLG